MSEPGVGVAQFLGAFGQGALQRARQQPQFHLGPNPGQQHLGVERLFHIVRATRREGAHRGLLIFLAGEEDHRNGAGAVVGLEPPAGFETVHPSRHPNIQQNEIERDFPGNRQSQFAAVRHMHLVAGLLEQTAHHPKVARVIIHHQDAAPGVFFLIG